MESSGLSHAVISRYRSGSRIPKTGSRQLEQLVEGLGSLAKTRESSLTTTKISMAFTDTLNRKNREYRFFHEHFISLTEVLEISMKELSAGINNDLTSLYRIRSGEHRPMDITAFTESLCHFVTDHYQTDEHLYLLHVLTGVDSKELAEPQSRFRRLKEWMFSPERRTRPSLDRVLHSLDSFDLEDYNRNSFSDDLCLPEQPLSSPGHYIGLDEIRKGELLFLRMTASSPSMEPVFMCNEMPMLDISEDENHYNNWICGIAAILKKGLRLNVIHNINRSFPEMLRGLEAWIPLCMTGQVFSWYLPGETCSNYQMVTYVSGSCSLFGECIRGFHNDGRYYLTSDEKDLSYFRKRSENLLKLARPLVKIYRIGDYDDYDLFLSEASSTIEDRRNILSIPPLCTMSQDLLEEILSSSRLTDSGKERIRFNHRREVKRFRNTLASCRIDDLLFVETKEQFLRHPISLPLPPQGSNAESVIQYTYEQYFRHVQQTSDAMSRYERYNLTETPVVFRNINIYICRSRYVVVGKNTAPAIRFVIRHPKLVHVFEEFAAGIGT